MICNCNALLRLCACGDRPQPQRKSAAALPMDAKSMGDAVCAPSIFSYLVSPSGIIFLCTATSAFIWNRYCVPEAVSVGMALFWYCRSPLLRVALWITSDEVDVNGACLGTSALPNSFCSLPRATLDSLTGSLPRLITYFSTPFIIRAT